MTHFNVTFFVSTNTTVRGTGGSHPALNVFPDKQGGYLTFQIDSRCSPEERIAIADRFVTAVTGWRDEMVAEADRARTTAEELAAAQEEIARLKAERAAGTKTAVDPVQDEAERATEQ
ncbi:hypothetical protein J3A78_003830 [Streptomyces sp. PvR006]|uniref:hypothetical protein n=1 Tax=Streptomyces sp. PvR006 TaxID=2817860 RepID=UPI001AE56D32|nr:hypothetical protein [Streptomyces sp. PvR006]MBP2583352.1 hypothetical protein [Streptomyces sp. PvR006]